jgi:hypothetical protein
MSNDKITSAASVVRWHLEERGKYPYGYNVARALKDPDVIEAVKPYIDVTVLGNYFPQTCYSIAAQIRETYDREEKAALLPGN